MMTKCALSENLNPPPPTVSFASCHPSTRPPPEGSQVGDLTVNVQSPWQDRHGLFRFFFALCRRLRPSAAPPAHADTDTPNTLWPPTRRFFPLSFAVLDHFTRSPRAPPHPVCHTPFLCFLGSAPRRPISNPHGLGITEWVRYMHFICHVQ